MKRRAGIIGTAALGLGLALSAQAYTSLYSSVGMAVPGTHNGWNTTSNMVLMADNVWVCTQTITAVTNEFKFATPGWTNNWGGISNWSRSSIVRVPAAASAPIVGGSNFVAFGLSPGPYRFIFNDSNKEFRMEWAGAAPLPLPVYTNMAVVGDFNGWSTNSNSRLTNNGAANTNLWSGMIALQGITPFQFRPNGNAAAQWGAPVPTTLSAPPVTNGSACGATNFVLSQFVPGTFRFSLNTSNATVAIHQLTTQSFSLATLTAQGSFIGTNAPPANMTKNSDSLWESDHHVTNNGTVTLRFAASNSIPHWGPTNGTPAFTLPASGSMVALSTNYAQITGVSTGRYRVVFNPQTGAFTFSRKYTEASGANLLKNPGFELVDLGGDGYYPKDWVTWQSQAMRVVDGYGPHSGSWCGAIRAKWFDNWTDYGSFSQSNLTVVAGRNYRASAWLKASADWTASTMQIKIEWTDATNGIAGLDTIATIPALSTNWTRYSVEGIAPSNATKAKVVYLCSGSGNFGTMDIDDVEMMAVGGRAQDFDSWGSLTAFGPYAPDWSITSGKTIWNQAPSRPPGGVFISQYVEGSGNNKAVEIFNGALTNVDLAAGNYVLQQYDNGSLSSSTNIALSGVLQSGTCLVVGRPNVPPAYAPDLAIANQPNLLTNKALTFNGDDVVVLRAGGAFGTILDRVGQSSTNATGSMWSRNATDRTLTRKSTIFTGTLGMASAAFPISEWDVSAKDDFTGLGSHILTYVDPNEPYTPAGFSLLMNTNAILMGGDFAGGIGDVSFWWRTETISPSVTVSIESSSSENGPWVTNATLTGSSTNFGYYAVGVNRADHLYVRFRQTGGAPNRFRIDEIYVSPYSATRRIEDFNAWTDPSYAFWGDHERYDWSIEDANIAPTSGAVGTRAALLSTPPDSAVVSPAFEGGVGEVIFWAKAANSNVPAYLILQTSLNGGTNWTQQGAFTVTNASTNTMWLYVTNAGAGVKLRIGFDPAKSSGDVLIDDVDVRVPALYRNQNFNGWPRKTSYTAGADSFQGWRITNCIMVTNLALIYDGQTAQLGAELNNYVQSPYLPGGIGSFSFWARNTTNVAATLSVQLSSNGTSWSTLATVSPLTNNYQGYSWYTGGGGTSYYVRILHASGATRLLIDDIASGIWQPRPSVQANPYLAPATPVINDPISFMASVVPRNGATILSVSNIFKINVSTWRTNGMAQTAASTYASTATVTVSTAGVPIRYQVAVQYAGLGAASNSIGYTTNVYLSPVFTNWVSTVPEGDVWINELFYASYSNNEPYETTLLCATSNPCDWFSPDIIGWQTVTNGSSHEFVELCGVAGTDLSGWSVELAFGSSADIAIHSNQATYATYKIPTNTVLTNKSNGYGFYVLGDLELATNQPVNLILTNALSAPPYYAVSIKPKDHIYDGVGVVRLLNQFGNVVYSLSYVGYASGSDRIPQNQAFAGETNSIGLAGPGSTYTGFNWEKTNMTVGAENANQTLTPRTPATNVYAYGWHTPSLSVFPVGPLPSFSMFDPQNAGHFDAIAIHYGYTNGAYPQPSGILYHRRSTASGWTETSMNIYEGSLDADNHAYVRGTIPARTYKRLDTIQYVVKVDPGTNAIQAVFLGSDGLNENFIYTNLTAAQASPFTYSIPIADQIYVTNALFAATNVTLWTEGNDPVDPLQNFYIRTGTNLQTPVALWGYTNFTGATNIYGQWTFNVRRTTNAAGRLFYAIQPLWP